MMNESTGFKELTGKKAPPRKPKIIIGKLRKFWIVAKFLLARPKNKPNPVIATDSHNSNIIRYIAFPFTGR